MLSKKYVVEVSEYVDVVESYLERHRVAELRQRGQFVWIHLSSMYVGYLNLMSVIT